MLEAEHEQDQDQADLGARLHEPTGRDEWQDAPFAERQPGEQVEGHRWQVESRGGPGEDREPQDDGAQLEESDVADPLLTTATRHSSREFRRRARLASRAARCYGRRNERGCNRWMTSGACRVRSNERRPRERSREAARS